MKFHDGTAFDAAAVKFNVERWWDRNHPHGYREAGNSTQLTRYPYDLQKARQLLAEAGYAKGFTLELWYMPVSRPYFPTPKPIGEAFAADLGAVGIQVNYGPGATDDIGNWKSDRLLQLLDQARATGTQSVRAKLYAEVDEILHREVLRLPIVHAQPLLAKRKTISGWIPSPFGVEPFESIHHVQR